jgi:SNF2 family DNA or RNA helicase
MKVSSIQPFQLIYSLMNHEHWGYLLEAHVVQLDTKGNLTLLNQSLSSKNAEEFKSGLESTDFELIKWIDASHQEVIWKKFSTKKHTPTEFFTRTYDPQKGDKALQEIIAGYLEKIRADIMPLLLQKRLFIMGNDGNPIWQEIEILPEKATVLFHFVRNEDNTHYYPTIKYAGQKVEFQYKNAFILCNEPAWMICENKLYHFEKEVDGKKLQPFLRKKFIVIPKKIEEDYYRKFVTSIVTSFDVYARGFEIRSEAYNCQTVLSVSESIVAQKSPALSFLSGNNDLVEEQSEEVELVFTLSFKYGKYTFRFDSFSARANVSMEKQGDDYVFHKVRRDLNSERDKMLKIKELGLNMLTGRAAVPKVQAFDWLQANMQKLNELGIIITQPFVENSKRYFLGYSSLEVSIREGNDWFDIYALVKFGEYEIPFIKLKALILRKKREFTLPNGEIAIIPQIWLTQYAELFAFAQETDASSLILKKHHIALVQALGQDNLAKVSMSRKLEKLRDFEEIEQYNVPAGFLGVLRPYQKAGYDWMRFLNDYQLGGCLADDMGLGKTIQTLALLQSQKQAEVGCPSLIIMPTSLIYNWQLEAEKFTPDLRVLIYTGPHREKNISQFAEYDLILTSYGIVRLDHEILEKFRFHYVILDESQAIKNPNSNITKAVLELNARYRLALTGTPLENSTLDLWSQFTFTNPGLLGNQTFFKNEFVIPIEKRNDEKKTKRLFEMIKPFMLRRHKAQVANDLPPKIESIHYAIMTEEQEQNYEQVKSEFRNAIMQQIEHEGMGKSQIMVLQGLTKLRQLANHPIMIDKTYEGKSGKFEDVLDKMQTVIDGGHKVLIFSQFVKHLDIFREHLNQNQTNYAYLDGNTQNRQAEVERFQNNADTLVFLISLKAGGVGLNLTAAEYVFILDPWWNPAVEAQAIDRAHRIGQNKTVFTYKFITKNSVEEKILALQKNKQRLANELITTEEGFVKSLSKEDLMTLLD